MPEPFSSLKSSLILVVSIRIVTDYVMTFRRIRSHVDIVDVVIDSQVARR